MSITLLCLVKGNTTTNAFPVHIGGNELVGDLKEAIKESQKPFFDGVPTKDIKLWKVTIPDDQDDLLSNLTLNDGDELLATKKISKYFPDSPAEEHIHVIVEQLLLRIKSKNFYYGIALKKFDVIVSPKRTKGFKWTVNINHATLEGLKKSIYAIYQTSALENDGAVFNIVSDSGKYSPRNDQDLCEMLQLLVSKNGLKFTVFIETPSKAFSDWTLGSICQLYGLSGETVDPTLSVFPVFSCGSVEPLHESFENLMIELNSRLDNTPINLLSVEATKSIYVYSYLLAGANNFKGMFEIRPQKNISGPNGHGPVDFAVDLRRTAKTVGVTEVKKEDFVKGIAQCAVQLESSLSNRKRKASEVEEEPTVGKVFGIVTDAEKFYFMECSLDEQDRPKFKLSKPVIVVYDDADMKAKVKKVLSHIIWLLEEVQKTAEVSQGENQSKIVKKHKSSSNLTEESG
ncbi:2716_t:CDS:2 [Paraglomus occultum]|uniref:2716_t:CDS:1 n=1 Tax=Paraglomus occultum TaxID=144539 RepID=A0A9N9G9N2_9GLOM|nr:2716_t:CDS:2 [Paraglomus occultum]